MMTKISNLPRDLTEEVLCRIPLTSLRRVRSTCKKWNTLYKDLSFAKKHLDVQAKVAEKQKEFMVVMMMDYKVYLMSINLHNNDESCIKRQGSLDYFIDDISITQVFHCHGLLFCIATEDHHCIYTLMLWNPYLGQSLWLEPRHNMKYHSSDKFTYALGYNKIKKSYKILRFINCYRSEFDEFGGPAYVEFKIIDLNSYSSKVLDFSPPHWYLCYHSSGVSLKGDTYWFATEKYSDEQNSFLVCFDFTSETFGPLLPLPFVFNSVNIYAKDTLTLSTVREENLAVLFQHKDTLMVEIWITTKIEPNVVSWGSKVFLEVDMRPFTCFEFQDTGLSFFY